MGLALALVFCVVLLIVLRIFLKPSSFYKLPPGPRGLPILGNVPQIIHNPHLVLSEWVKQYGPLFTIHFGMRKALVISNSKLMTQILSLPASTGKYKTDTMLLTSRGAHGVLHTDGNVWYEQRQFMLKSLVKHGFGNKTSLEPKIMLEAQEVVEWINKEMELYGKVSVEDILSIATNNTLLSMVTGERVGLESVRVVKLLKNLLENMQNTVKTGLNFLPILKYIAPSASGFTGLDNASQEISDFINSYIKQHRDTFIPGVERDVIDCYLEHLRGVQDPSSSFYGAFGEKNFSSSILEIFNAGGETTPRSLEWLVLYLSVEQEVQSKMQREIDNVIGRNRDPSLLDKPNLPYTEAVILETLRKSSLIPLGLIHELLEDTKFEEFVLPKGMLLIPNMYHVHHDINVWGDPDAFRPERFLDEKEKGSTFLRENVVAFQPGRRACLGEPLAKDIMFLFATKLFQTFHVTPDPTCPKPSLEPDVGIGLVAKPFKVVMKPRI